MSLTDDLLSQPQGAPLQQVSQQLGLDSEYGALADQRLLLLARGDLAVAQAARALAYVSLYKALGGAPLPARQPEDPAS